jgi:hypothetical protein
MAESEPLRGAAGLVIAGPFKTVREMPMQVAQDRPDLVTLATVIAHSPIVVATPAFTRIRLLPAGFDAADADILDWIATECRRTRLGYWLM